MGLIKRASQSLKESIKKAYQENRRIAREQRAFNQILSKKLETARRQAIAKEMEIQIRKRAKQRVKAKFTPKKQTSIKDLKEDIFRGLPP